MKTYQLAAAVAAATLLAGAANATAPFTVSYEGEAPGVQNTTATFNVSGVETFSKIATGLGNNFSTDFGTNGQITGVFNNVQINSADQYGGAGGDGRYPVAFGSTPYELRLSTALAGGVNYFGYWLSALDAGNLVTFFSGGQELFQFRPQDVIDAISATATPREYYGNPNANRLGQNSGEPYIFLNFFDNAGSFDKVVFQETPASGGYESDNHTVGNFVTNPGLGTDVPLNQSNNPPIPVANVPGVPEPASWALMLVGFGGMGTALRRRKALVAA
jgi:hypothetical protein